MCQHRKERRDGLADAEAERVMADGRALVINGTKISVVSMNDAHVPSRRSSRPLNVCMRTCHQCSLPSRQEELVWILKGAVPLPRSACCIFRWRCK